eukprot:TRINITY_DN10037_c0_g1_i3.p1 TRINITY_DN10037_c0_g1~~TRINITY_DN10037_c0_g1_i3.p1  ORF type:complete len:197 (-),score=27.45 TRINITY_DN10037_c0_g1_i3:337-927(-)
MNTNCGIQMPNEDLLRAILFKDGAKITERIRNDPECVKLICSLGRTPLFLAAQYGHTKILSLLLQACDSNIDQGDQDGWTPLFVASLNGHYELVKLLLSHSFYENNPSKCDVIENTKEWTPFFAAIAGNHLKVAALLHSKGANISAKDKRGQTPLFLAAAFNRLEAITFLVNAGADVNERDKFSVFYFIGFLLVLN